MLLPGLLPVSEEIAVAASDHPEHQHLVDATGLTCPLPILRAKKTLSIMASGEVLQIITTDRGAVRDFQAFCRQTGNTLLAQFDETERVVHYLKRR